MIRRAAIYRETESIVCNIEKMKVIAIILVIVSVAFVLSQLWANSQVKEIEQYPYTVLETYDSFEIRQYEEANFIYATMDAKSYEESSSRGFNILAGYIFGGNESQQKIAMTSPVVMEMDEQITMKFLVPAQYDMASMPKPDNIEVKFMTEKERKMAAITFGGYADDQKIAVQRDLLFAALAAEGIEHSGDWSFMGYDPPFKLINRKNEVVVVLQD
jgi:hypothetical protein